MGKKKGKKEVWKPIFNDTLGIYEVSDLGRLRNVKSGKVLKLHYHPKRNTVYAHINVRWSFRSWAQREHHTFSHLVYNAFSAEDDKIIHQLYGGGSSIKGLRVGHKDGNPRNNRFSNLYRY